jgi:Tfp pilus assembly protein PilE
MTLVEIMVTLVISSIIAASTFMFFAGQQRIYEAQAQILNIQQNVWAAIEVVGRFGRSAGSGMFDCVSPANYANTNSSTGGRLQTTVPGPSVLTTNLTTRPAAGVRAYDDTTNGAQWIPPLWIVNNSTTDTGVVANTDILTVAFGDRASGADADATLLTTFASTDPGTSIELSGVNTGNIFRLGEMILMLTLPPWGYGADPTGDRGCTLFKITTDPVASSLLVHASTLLGALGETANNNARIWNPPAHVPALIPAAGFVGPGQAGIRNFGQLVWIRFYIGLNGTSGVPALFMQRLDMPAAGQGAPQVLAEGIEDFQISFACDVGPASGPNLSLPNGHLDEGSTDNEMKTDEWWNNVPADTLPASGTAGFCNLPTALRFTLVARSINPDDLIDATLSGNGPIDVEDHRYSPRPTDQFRRRVMTTTVYPRNNKPTL